MALYDNFPYTNFHELNLDWIISTVKQIQTEWNNLSGDINATAVSSTFPSVTVTGSLQEGLTFNFGLPQGTPGTDGADGVSVTNVSISNTGYLTISLSDGSTYTSPISLIGPAGPEGPTGAGIDIVGTVATTSDLPASGTAGQAYLVGTGAPYTLYVWASGSSAWISAGTMGSSVSPSSSVPLMDGTGAAGTATTYSRADHVHPHDTSKQDVLTSSDLATVNGQSVLGNTAIQVQPVLQSGTDIVTINTQTLLQSGNMSLQPTLQSGVNIKTVNSQDLLGNGDLAVQAVLQSGTNIKTINGQTLLDSGNIATVQTYSGSDDPNDLAAFGNNGDLYIQIEE